MKRGLYPTLLLLFFTIMCGCLSAMAQSGTKVHIVQKNETLYRIGRKYHITVSDLYKLNPSAREGIRPGQTLVLPDSAMLSQPSGADTSDGMIYHAVQKGETLYAIARRYSVSVRDILAANPSIKSVDSVPLGIVLRIPASSAAPQEEVTPRATPVAPSPSATELKVISVPAGATIYTIVRSTDWTEEDFYKQNPQARNGLIAGSKILVPTTYSTAQSDEPVTGFQPVGRVITAVLALPFKTDTGRRFADYYEGFLLMLKDAKEKGINVDLYVYDCSDDLMPQTLRELNKLTHIDLLIGGVSLQSMDQLATVAHQKGAVYVIPFTSRKLTATDLDGLQIYQINTPHESLYNVAAEKFVSHYAGYHVHFVHYDDNSQKESFVRDLKNKMHDVGMRYSQSESSEFEQPEKLDALIRTYDKVVIVPTSASQIAANNTMAPIQNAVDSLGIDVNKVTVFGYPEWQTYTHSIGKLMRAVNATIYTTFYVNLYDKAYQDFQKDFISWFGHGTGITFPKYSILGYDTGAFFVMPTVGEPVGAGANFIGDRQYQGVQSNFFFRSDREQKDLHSNHGVFFVRYLLDGKVERF